MIYVMSDIHGNLERFESIMRQINLKQEDRLYILVHASPVDNYYLDPLNEYEYGDEEYFAVWARWKPHYPIPVGYNLIFGHTPTIYFHNKELWKIWKDDRAIGIDCGCGYEQGRLACLRLDDMAEFYV